MSEGGQGENGEPQNGEGNGSSSDGTREMSDEEFEEFSDQMAGSSPMSGDMDSNPTGGSGMDVQNLPQNMQGGKPSSSSNGGKETEKVTLSDRQKDLLEKKIKKQKIAIKKQLK